MLGFLSPGVDGGTRRGGRRSLPGPVHLAWDGTTWPLPPSGICAEESWEWVSGPAVPPWATTASPE